ncbi:MAG: hypothetical protein MZV70_33700 [Desulfobacterales bacterium]|nr:hypothetical protein [Desulfobacterales bacterium]
MPMNPTPTAPSRPPRCWGSPSPPLRRGRAGQPAFRPERLHAGGRAPRLHGALDRQLRAVAGRLAARHPGAGPARPRHGRHPLRRDPHG